jgi:probable DNA metabolism protein
MEPQFNVLPLAIDHFRDRFADQKWLIYDLKRKYGYYYDLHEVTEVTFPDLENHHITGKLNEALLAEDEKVFQKLWKTYFKAIAIKERINPRLHKHNMPVRYWKHLTEKQ